MTPAGSGRGLVPDRYRAVSVATFPPGGEPNGERPAGDDSLSAPALRAALIGRPAYRRTVFIVARSGECAAVVRVRRRDDAPLFSEIVDVEVLAGPGETAVLVRPDVDVGVPSQIAAAAEAAPDARCVVVTGRYQHVSFILDPRAVRVHILDTVPPEPAKLVDQVRRVLDTAEDLPPVRPVPAVVDLADLAARSPSAHYLVPCRGGGMLLPGSQVSYLDEVPPRADWTLLGCARSQAIHAFFYGPAMRSIDTCPKTLAAAQAVPDGEVLLTKCCLREVGVGVEDGVVVVPWGATAAEVLDGLRLAAEVALQVTVPTPPAAPGQAAVRQAPS